MMTMLIRIIMIDVDNDEIRKTMINLKIRILNILMAYLSVAMRGTILPPSLNIWRML